MTLYTCSETLKVLEKVLDIDTHIRGLDYLEKIAANIYRYFNLEYVIIGKAVLPEKTKVETIVALSNGVKIENFGYELQNSPCENVCTSKKVCVYEDDVLKDFKNHSLITDLGIEAYVGSPLMQDNEIFGLLVFLESKAIEYPEYYESLISVLASRISVEIERYNNDQVVISLQQSNIELSAQNQHDGLTGAFNREFFSLHVQELLDKGVKGSLLFFDLDDFKTINDTHGHQAGDDVLKYFAEVIDKEIRKGDLFARYGGEEFVLFLPATNKDTTLSITQRIHKKFDNAKNNVHHVTVSIGVSVMVESSHDLDALIKNADLALYEAKTLGKNQTVCS